MCASESVGGRGSSNADSESAGLGWGLELCISAGRAGVADPQVTPSSEFLETQNQSLPSLGALESPTFGEREGDPERSGTHPRLNFRQGDPFRGPWFGPSSPVRQAQDREVDPLPWGPPAPVSSLGHEGEKWPTGP